MQTFALLQLGAVTPRPADHKHEASLPETAETQKVCLLGILLSVITHTHSCDGGTCIYIYIYLDTLSSPRGSYEADGVFEDGSRGGGGGVFLEDQPPADERHVHTEREGGRGVHYQELGVLRLEAADVFLQGETNNTRVM